MLDRCAVVDYQKYHKNSVKFYNNTIIPVETIMLFYCGTDQTEVPLPPRSAERTATLLVCVACLLYMKMTAYLSAP